MKRKLLDYLSCPSCAGALRLASIAQLEDSEIIEGQLACQSCGRSFPILRGVPRFARLEEMETDQAATAASFGWQWQHFTQAEEFYAEQFLGWIAPVKPEFFQGKVVLEGGCGKGRHTQLAARWGARDVIGVDLSAAVDTAFAATRHLENAHIIQGDLYHLPVAKKIDYAFSVGVLHHLPDPRAGFVSLASKLKPGGHLSAWVYGAENNEWITKWISPLRRRLTSRLNPRALLHLSKLPAALIYITTKLVYRPLNQIAGGAMAQHLFYNDYLMAISRFGWKEQHTIVFDHLVAPTAHYVSRSDFDRWWRDVAASGVVIAWHNKNSWCGWGRIK